MENQTKLQAVNTFLKGMNKDADVLNLQDGEYIEAWNVVDNSDNGSAAMLSNERGFELAYEADRTESHAGDAGWQVIGSCPLTGVGPDGNYYRWQVLFLVQAIAPFRSEIGIWDYASKQYHTKVNDGLTFTGTEPTYKTGFTVNNAGTSKLNFSRHYQVDATGRQIANLHRIAYFTDNLNRPRYVDLDQVTDYIDIARQTALFADMELPVCEFVEVVDGGNVKPGSYQFIARYLSKDLLPTTFGLPCNQIPVVDESEASNWIAYDGIGYINAVGVKSIKLTVSNLDPIYDYVEVAVIYREGSDLSFKARTFNRFKITQSSIEVLFDGNFPDNSQELLLEDIVQRPISYSKAAHIIQKDNRLLLSNLEKTQYYAELQKVANEIVVSYTIKNIDYDVFQQNPSSKPGYKSTYNCYKNKGYQRGESYSLGFGVIFKDGSLSEAFHIPAFRHLSDSDYSDWLAMMATSGEQHLKADTSSKRVGVYKSLQTTQLYNAPSWRTPAVNAALGISASDPFPICHHFMPTLKQEPHFAYLPVSPPQCSVRVLGLKFDNIDFSYITDTFIRETLKSNIQGIYFCREERNTINNRTILAQGFHNKAMWLESNDVSRYNILHLNPLNGDTDVQHPGADAFMYHFVFSRDFHDSTKDQNTRYVSSRYCGFWSPDTILANREVSPNYITPELRLNEDYPRVIASTDTKQFVNHSWYLEAWGGVDIVYEPYYNATLSQRRSIKRLWKQAYSPSSAVLSPVKTNPLFSTDLDIDDSSFPTPVAVQGTKVWNRGTEDYLLLELHDAAANDVVGFSETLINDTNSTSNSANNIYHYPFVLNSVSGRDRYDLTISNSSFTKSVHSRYLSNLRVHLTAQYGTLDNKEYSIIDSLYFNLNQITFVGDKIYFGSQPYFFAFNGDTFVCQFSYRNSAAFRRVGAGVTYQGINANHHLRTVTSFFVECATNAEYRHRELDQNGNYGPPYWPNPTGTPYSLSDPDSVWGYDSVAGQAKGYNEQYSLLSNTKPTFSFGLNPLFVNRFPTRTIYSQFSEEGEQQDRYRIFLPNDYHDLPKHSGEITNQFVWNGELYLHTSASLWRTFFNSMGAIASTLGEVYLGTGKVFAKPSQELFSLDGGYAGCQHKWGSVTTPFGHFFVDAQNAKVFLLTDTLEEISYEGRMSKWFLSNLQLQQNPYSAGHPLYNPNFNNNPANLFATGIVAVYDQRHRRVLLGINYQADDSTKYHTLSYSFLGKIWRSFHSYRLAHPFHIGNQVVEKYGSTLEFVFFEHGVGDFGNFPIQVPPWLDSFPSSIEFGVRELPDVTKTFTNQTVNMEVTDIDTSLKLYNLFFAAARYHNEFQNSGEVAFNLSYPTSTNYNVDNVRYVNREWRLAIPRDMVVDKMQPLESTSNLYQPIGSIPPPALSYFQKLKGKFLKIKYIWDNNVNSRVRFDLRYIKTFFRPNHR